VIAADGGARTAEALGVPVDLVVGDGDSLGEAGLARLRAAGVEVREAAVDKDETDTELAVLEAVARHAGRITILGALGGERLDHELANVGLLAHDALASTDAAIVDPRGRFSLVRAPGPDGSAVTTRLTGAPGSIVSLLAFGSEVHGITTVGLRYPLADESLRLGPARGLSNVVTSRAAGVTVRDGLLLIVEAPATLGR
jgi:thiamine pyrophosphokinase